MNTLTIFTVTITGAQAMAKPARIKEISVKSTHQTTIQPHMKLRGMIITIV